MTAIPKQTKFQSFVENELSELASMYWPDKFQNGAGNVWHQAPSDRQVGDSHDRGIPVEKAVSISSCGQSKYEDAIMPKSIHRTTEPRVCEECARLGEVKGYQMKTEVAEIVKAIVTKWDEQTYR